MQKKKKKLLQISSKITLLRLYQCFKICKHVLNDIKERFYVKKKSKIFKSKILLVPQDIIKTYNENIDKKFELLKNICCT